MPLRRPPRRGVLAAGADEVSAAITTIFAAHAQAYQALSAQAATFHQQFVQLMHAGAGSYASAEAANASPLQAFEGALLNRFNEAVAELETDSGVVTALTEADLARAVSAQMQLNLWMQQDRHPGLADKT